MASLHNINCSPSQSVERMMSPCSCAHKKETEKAKEQIIADIQLKEKFKKDLRKDILKLCLELEGLDRTGRKDSKISDAMKKKAHFLPPLRKQSEGYRTGVNKNLRLYDDMYGEGEEDGSGFGSGFGMGTGMGYRYRSGKKKKYFDRYGNKYGRKLGDSSTKGYFDRYGYKYGRKPGDSSTDFSSDLEMYGSGFGFGKDEGDENEFYSMSGIEWDKRTDYLLKYYQLKKMAEKLESRKPKQPRRQTDNKDYEEGFKSGFFFGHKEAFNAEPVYIKVAADLYKKVFHEAPEYVQTIHYNIKPMEVDAVKSEEVDTVEQKQELDNDLSEDKEIMRTIYVSTEESQVDELRVQFKDVEIEGIQDKIFSCLTETEAIQKIDDLIQIYRSTDLSDKTEEFIKGFQAGFYDSFKQTFIYQAKDPLFNDEEKSYISEVRKLIMYDEDDMDGDQKCLLERAENLKETYKNIIDFDAYEKEIESLNLSKSLHFTKSDFLFFYSSRTKKKKAKERSKFKTKRRGKIIPPTGDEELELDARRKVKNTDDRAWGYFDKHNIEDIFRYMGIMLCAYKPDDPIDFLVNLLDKCLLYRANECHNKAPLIFTEKHVESIYKNMDPFNYGYIDGNQYLYGLNLLQVSEADDSVLIQNTSTVKKDLFLTNANTRLLVKFKNMIRVV